MGSLKATFAYGLYALAAAVVFLYLLFPEDAVKAYMDGRLAAIDPTLSITAEAIRPAIPPGLKMSGVDLNRNDSRVARFDQAGLTPDLASLLKEQKRFQFRALLADGTIVGSAFKEDSDPSGRLRMEADLSAIRLEKLDALQSLPRFTLAGSLNGRLTHDGASAPAGKLDGLLTVEGLRVTLKNAFFGINELTMSQTEADFSISGQTLRLKTFSFDGPLMEGKVNGTIELGNPFTRSRLNLSGNVKPRPEFFTRLQGTIPQEIVNPRTIGTRGLNFRIQGTIDNPDVSMR